MKDIIWKQESYGFNAFIGYVKIGFIFYDGTKSLDDKLKYKATTLLPSIKNNTRSYESLEEGKKFIESAFKYFIDKIT